MIIYYKVIEVWCKWPFQHEIDYRYCIFSISKKKFHKNIINFEMPSTTTLEEKRIELQKFLNEKVTKVEKL